MGLLLQTTAPQETSNPPGRVLASSRTPHQGAREEGRYKQVLRVGDTSVGITLPKWNCLSFRTVTSTTLAIYAALLPPIVLDNLHSVLNGFVIHLLRANERSRRPRQLDTIKLMLG